MFSFTRYVPAVLMGFVLLALAPRPATPQTAPAKAAPAAWDTYSDTWVATDGLGRVLPTFADVGPPRPHHQVGMFYFLWIDGRTGVVNDNSKIPHIDDAVVPYKAGSWHWWGEPLLGYYKIDDPFVLRKHAQMLHDAGVDTLVFDTSNGYTHDEQVDALCKVYTDVRALNGPQSTPQFAHLLNARADQAAATVYDKFYTPQRYPDLWFRWLGKPLLLAPPDKLTPAQRDYFTVRQSWAWSKGKWFGDGKDKWPWLDHYPQKAGWHTDPAKTEALSVCVAQHPTSEIGRSYHNGKEPPAADRNADVGLCYTEQWSQAYKTDAPFVFVTGWNEWIAPIQKANDKTVFLGKHLKAGDAFFVDEYSPEFSRDAEPTRGDLADNYYYQTVAAIRRYKGVRPLPPVTPRTIHLDRMEDWATVQSEYRDTIGDPAQRDFAGFAKGTTYTNHSGRNDIIAAKVAYNKDNVYFYVRTRDPLTSPTAPHWMELYLDTDHNARTGWLGYDFVVNHVSPKGNVAYIERNRGGAYQWEAPVAVPMRVVGNQIVLAIPRRVLKISDPATIDFKWADNCIERGEWSDFTLNGDAAPNDRFNYRAVLGGGR